VAIKKHTHREKTFLSLNHLFIPIVICTLFSIAYILLTFVRHYHFGSFGYDLGINDQAIWHYSRFEAPISTIGPIPFQSKLTYHLEFIYLLLAPFYWIWSSPYMLLFVEVVVVCFSAIPMYLLARRYNINMVLSYALLLSYLLYYGVQHALWFDFHSTTFSAAFISWFIYFLDKKQLIPTLIFFVLAITSKEDVPFITFFISLVFLYKTRWKINILLMSLSMLYLLSIFFIYFPTMTPGGYLYKNPEGLLSSIDPIELIDTHDKRHVFFYSFLSVGFIPIISPVYLLPVLAHFYAFFVLSDNPAFQNIYMHYRVITAPLLIWATIWTIRKLPKLNHRLTGVFIISCVFVAQYTLHLPLSYLTKSWFWTTPPSTNNIRDILSSLPSDASVVSQNNITPHISQRQVIFTLWPEKKTFINNSPCGGPVCDWFRWEGNPEYLIVDTAESWDTRHFLTDRTTFINALENLEKQSVISLHKKSASAVLYKIHRNPAQE
jgi:uncharacterized membrane protein